MTQAQYFPEKAGIIAASRFIDPVFLRTPLITQSTADAALGCALFAKVETLNPIRSFKGRGTDWWMQQQPGDVTTIVSASAGNFGQGLAWAGRRQGRTVVIYAATTANPAKIEAMRRLGADVRLQGADFDAAKDAARRFATENGFVFVEDGAHREIAEGAGTIALEITETLANLGKTLDAIIVPLGNGALLTGVGAWMRAEMPSCKVVGVVAANAPAMKCSFEGGTIVSTEMAATTADGIAVRQCVPYALDCMRETVDAVWAVDEATIADARAFCLRHYGLVVEEAGAAGVAGLLAQRAALTGKTVATILCGGNVRLEYS